MTLSASSRNDSNPAAATGFVYLLITLFCVFFGAVYEYFSHEVYSFYMIYAFVFPLVGGTLPFYGIFLLNKPMPRRLACNLYHSGIAALTVGSIFTGVLEIYGTTNGLTVVYWIVGFSLIILAMICQVFYKTKLTTKGN